MFAIATLTFEHRVIERALLALEGLVAEARATGFDGREDLSRLAGFLTAYLQEVHFPKEVDVLLARLLEEAPSPARGPIAVTLEQHESVVLASKWLELAAISSIPWTALDVERIGQAVTDLAIRSRDHMAREEKVVFALADQFLGADAAEAVEALFDAHAHEVDRRTRELADLAASLIERWAAADPSPAPESGRARQSAAPASAAHAA